MCNPSQLKSRHTRIPLEHHGGVVYESSHFDPPDRQYHHRKSLCEQTRDKRWLLRDWLGHSGIKDICQPREDAEFLLVKVLCMLDARTMTSHSRHDAAAASSPAIFPCSDTEETTGKVLRGAAGRFPLWISLADRQHQPVSDPRRINSAEQAAPC